LDDEIAARNFPKRMTIPSTPVSGALVPFSQRKLVVLDGVRGLAIIAVMLTHIALQHVTLSPVLRGTFALGWAGVDLFFVLSGFLITGILLDTRECRNYFRSFYARRILRIFPLYYGVLSIVLLVFPWFVNPDYMPDPSHRWMYVCYLANWQRHAQWHVLTHFWSLCVEEQFYFVWPLVVLLAGPRRLLPLVIALEVAVLSGRSWWVYHHGASPVVQYATITRMDGLLLGAACAVIVRHFHITRRTIGILPWVAMLFLTAFVARYHMVAYTARLAFTESIGYALLAISFAAFVMYCVLTEGQAGWPQRWLCWKPLLLMGKYSYGIYVFHFPIFYLAERFCRRLPHSIHEAIWFACLLIGFESAASFLVASLSYNYFEKRFLALKDRFAPMYTEAPIASTPALLQVG
jgi:peptidoglycan/LPS O-acetylase OafA/YrhL